MVSCRILVPHPAIERAAGGFFADLIHGISCAAPPIALFAPFTIRSQKDSSAWVFSMLRWMWMRPPFTPLFKKERHASRLALIADRAYPIRVHRPRLRAALAANEEPVNWQFPACCYERLFLIPVLRIWRMPRNLP